MISEFYYGSTWHWPLPYLPRVMLSWNMLRKLKAPWIIDKPWMMDSGAYAIILNRGSYEWDIQTYAEGIQKWNPGTAWTMDYPCEPSVRARGNYNTLQAQQMTNQNTVGLMELGIDISNVLQGWTIDDYLRNLDQIKEDGLVTGRMAIGSICRRGQTSQIARIIRTVKRELPAWVKLHAFGVKSNVLSTDAKYFLHSADSQSWSIQERYYSWGKNSNKGLTWHDKVPSLLSYVEKMEAMLKPETATLLPYIQNAGEVP